MTATETMPVLKSQGYELNTSPEHFGWLRSSSDLLDDVSALRARMGEDGYLFLPGLLEREQVLAARQAVAERLQAVGVLDPAAPLMDCVARPDTCVTFMPEVARDNPALMKVVYAGPMMAFFQQFLGEMVRHYDYTWFRVVAPGRGTRCHCDVVYMGRGETERLYTAWTPIGDVDLVQGGLMVLEGSHRNERLKETYGKYDVDSYCNNRAEKRDGWQKGQGGFLARSPVQIQKSIGGRWLTCPNFQAGDVLIFSVYTVHASLDNHSNRIRLSSDTRYQPASQPADERWIGENPVAHGAAGKRGKIC